MPQLTAKTRAQLRNAAFAYVDSKGRRRLPIHDEAHVRNALARFNQTRFEDDAARERARKRLLTAAKKYRIVPIGFITGQLATERLEGESRARAGVVRGLPSGQVTFLLSDIEDSTGLLRLLEDKYANLLADVRRLLRRAVQRSGGREVEIRADELFAVFKRPSGALAAALAIQRRLGSRSWPAGAKVRLRIGIHTGRPTLTDGGTWGWQCTPRRASALRVTAVKSCSRATRYERSRHRLLATSAFVAWARTGSRACRNRSLSSSWRRQTFRQTSRHLGPQTGHCGLLRNQRSMLAVQTAWLEH